MVLRLIEIKDDRVQGLRTLLRIGLETWYRTLLPELIPDCERILYLDVDTLVVDDLEPLWTLDLEGQDIAAVPNVFEPELANHVVTLGLSADAYFNAGVLLLNLKSLRASGRMKQVLAYAREHRERLVLSDQDALNAVLGKRCLILHPRWNCQNSLFYLPEARNVFGMATLQEATRRPAILHFEGPGLNKPWHYLSRHPLRRLYFEHRRATPWPVVNIEGRTWISRLLRPLPIPALIALLKSSGRLRETARRFRDRIHARCLRWQRTCRF